MKTYTNKEIKLQSLGMAVLHSVVIIAIVLNVIFDKSNFDGNIGSLIIGAILTLIFMAWNAFEIKDHIKDYKAL